MTYAIYQPKGSMCMACALKNQDCSSLEFSQMKVMFALRDAAIVYCTVFTPVKPAGPTA